MNYSTIIGSSLIAVFSGLWYIGVFDTIKFHEGKIPAGKFVYKNHAGPMKDCGPHFSEVWELLKLHGVQEMYPTLGMFYEDPQTTPNPRYAVGFLVEAKYEQLYQSFAKEFSAQGFLQLELKETKTLSTSFPLRAGIASYTLSAMKVYPAFMNKNLEMKCGSVEVYLKDTIVTHFPQENYELYLPQDSK